MTNTERQLAEGVCESIAHTTPRFRPPSRTGDVVRVLTGWAAALALLCIATVIATRS